MKKEHAIEKFNHLQENLELLELMPGEEVKHCINEDYGRKFFEPNWVVSNKGRVYSLPHDKWLIPSAMGNNRRYWGLNGSTIKNVLIHQLVCFYFQDESDQVAIKYFGLDNLEVHHEIPIDIPNELKSKNGNEQERMAHCMKCSSKSNLWYQEKEIDHIDDHRVADGKKTIGEENGTAQWDESLSLFRTIASNSGKVEGNNNGVRKTYSFDVNGNLKTNITITMKVKGSEE